MKILNISYMAAAAIALSSCSGFLDAPTDTRVDLVNTDQVRMLMNSAYPDVSYAWPCEIMSDNIEDNNSPEGQGNEGIHYNLPSFDRGDDEMFRWETCVSNTNTDSPSIIWEEFYGSIAACNAVLERLDQWEQQNGTLDRTQTAIRAEAKILRAFDAFILAQVFCQPYRGSLSDSELGIPYPTSPETTVKPHYERGTLTETYAKIQKDLEDALPDIDNGLYSAPKYHFNQTAAYAFAARFYLFTRQYEKALQYANATFGGEGIDPTPFLSDIWSKLGDFYYVMDFGLYQKGQDKASNFLLYPTHTQQLRRMGNGCRYAVIRDALYSTIYSASPIWSRFKWSLSNGKGGEFTMHPCFNGILIDNGGQSEYGTIMVGTVDEQFEYTDKIAGIGYVRMTRREFFGEETLLTRAEAKLFLGDTNGAIEDLKTWERVRRNCPAALGKEFAFAELTLEGIKSFYADNDPGHGIAKTINIDQICPESDARVSTDAIMPVLQCVQHFRRIETIHTGMRWFDIKRFGIEFDRKIGNLVAPNYHVMDHLSITDPRKAVQIPAEVVAAGMQANPRGNAPETVSPASARVSSL